MDLESIWNNFKNDVTSFLSPSDTLPWTDIGTIEACERDILDPGQQAAHKENLFKLAWSLVHSRRQSDIRRGLAMLTEQLHSDADPKRQHEVLYLLAVGHFRLSELPASRQFVELALERNPQSLQYQRLHTQVLEKIKSDGLIGIGIAGGVAATVATAAVVVAAVVAAKR